MHNLTTEEKKDIYSSFLGANYWWIALSIIVGIVSHVSRTLRWKILLEPMGYNPGFRNTFLSVMIGYFANLALPRLGEVTRCGILAKYEKIPFQKSFGTVVTERGLDMIMLIIAFIINFFIHLDKLAVFRQSTIYQNIVAKYNEIENPGMIYWILLIIIALLAFFFFKFRHKISHTAIYIKIKDIILGFLRRDKITGKN